MIDLRVKGQGQGDKMSMSDLEARREARRRSRLEREYVINIDTFNYPNY